MSLAVNDALMHIPNFYVFWNLGSIISGAIFYQVPAQRDSATVRQRNSRDRDRGKQGQRQR